MNVKIMIKNNKKDYQYDIELSAEIYLSPNLKAIKNANREII